MTQIKLYEAECAWVPGTTDRVRFSCASGGKFKAQVKELKLARLVAMFGRGLINDLYLRGRVRLRVNDRQLSELAY